MKTAALELPGWRVAATLLLTGAVASCSLLPTSRPQAARMLTLPAARPSELIVIVDQGSSVDLATARTLLVESARAGERVIVIGERGAIALVSSAAPVSPSTKAPEPPAPLPADPTSFQKARHSQAVLQYQIQVQQTRHSLQELKQTELVSWAQGVAAKGESRAEQLRAGVPDITASLGTAATDLASLRQSGSGLAGEAIAIIGVSAVAALSAPSVSASLPGSTVVVDNFPGTDDEEAEWQAAMDQGGVSRTVILSQATDSQLAATVRQGLDGAVADTLTSVLFGLDSSMLRSAALPQLRRLLQLLAVTYPDAAATVDGYTDTLPAPGGNLQLSRRRAEEVVTWLIAHHVSADRLQAIGCDDIDPVAPNTPHGQPLNRRVVVIIDPATDS